MDELHNIAKSNLTSTIFSEYNEMRKNELFCDFQIKVGSQSFHVHRSLLIAASKYFKALFSSNMKEVEQEFIDMKDVDAEGVKYCIEFIYTREIDLSKAPVELTLHASHLMQLDDLTDLCFGYLKLHITPESSISTLKLAHFYNRDELINIAGQYITDQLKAVFSTDSFLALDRSDMLRHLNMYCVDNFVFWQAVLKWVSSQNEDSEQLMLELMKSLLIEKFPFKFLLETVLNELLVQRSQTLRNLVIRYLFVNVDALKENISLQTVFNLKDLAKNNTVPNAVVFKKLLCIFMEDNFEKLTQEDHFNDLEQEDILFLFQSQNTKYSLEKTKFNAALKWANKNESNSQSFPNLLTCIQLGLLSPEFIQQIVLTEPLLKKFPDCKNLLQDHYAWTKTPPQQIAVLDRTGIIIALNLITNQWSNVAKAPESNYKSIIVSIKNMLFLLNNETVSILQKDGTWRKKTALRRWPTKVVSFQNCIYGIDDCNMFCYDPMQGTWKTNLPGCGLGQGFCVAASSEYIYGMGGYFTLDFAKRFDQKTGEWSFIASMNNMRHYASSSAMNRLVIVMGGMGRYSKLLNSVEFYNPGVDSWTEITNMCCFRYFNSSCVVNENLYVVGGQVFANGGFCNPDSVEVYERGSMKWRIIQNMNLSPQIICCPFLL